MRDSFVLYTKIDEVLSELDDAATAELFRVIVEYEKTGTVPEFHNLTAKIAFIPVRQELDRNNQKWEEEKEKRRKAAGIANAAKRAKRDASEPNGTERNRTEPIATESEPNGTERNAVRADNVYVNVNDNVSPTEIDKKPQRTQASLVAESNLSDPVKEKLLEWLRYKKERRESYKETGLRALISEVHRHELEDGADAVIAIINESMANGWRGIIWEKRNNRQSTARSGPKEKIHTFTENAYDFKSLEAQLIKNA